MMLGKCIEIDVNIEKGVFFGDFSKNVGISQFFKPEQLPQIKVMSWFSSSLRSLIPGLIDTRERL